MSLAKNKQIRRTGHRFSEVPAANIPRSRFDRSHGLKTTFDAGYLIPIFLDEVLPGDTHNLSMTAFARMATPLHPVMDNMYLETFFFFVPNRLVWENWQRFMGEEPNPGDSTDFIIPGLNSGQTVAQGSLADYLGLPIGLQTTAPSASRRISVLPFRAYNLIWNEWFRDQNLQDRAPESKSDSGQLLTDFPIRRRGKRHDYFTSALPWPQKGDSVELPLGSVAPLQEINSLNSPTFRGASSGTTGPLQPTATSSTPNVRLQGSPSSFDQFENLRWEDPNLEVDLAAATAATINQLRQAFQVQKLLERNARGGTRYVEIIKAHFGVTSPDQRLQRPEYLGGGRTMIDMGAIPQTSATDAAVTEQGNLAGIATASAHNHGFVKSFVEHGYVIGLVSVRADLTYQQGLHRSWSRQTRFDFYWPALAQIGEQAVLSREIFVGNASGDGDVFGYQERYAEYRYKPSQVTSLFRSDATGSLDVWHLAQDFGSRPVLNDAFIQENPPVDRVIAVPDEPHFIMDCYFSLKSARPMPVFGVPGLIDHF